MVKYPGGVSSAPSISIITPSYNRSSLLARTIASVALQGYSRVEHIVVDGGSTDDTCLLLERAERTCGTRWISEPDSGMYDAINRGLNLATGDLVSWVNSDDWLLPWCAEVAAANSKNATRAVFSDILTADLGAPIAFPRVSGAFSARRLAAIGTLPQPTVFWPRAITSIVGGLDGARYSEVADCDYWLRMASHVEFHKVREFTAVTFDHPSTKRSLNRGRVEDELASIRASYDTSGLPPSVWRLINAIAWRREWAGLLFEHGWSHSRESGLTTIARLSRPRREAVRRLSPVHGRRSGGATVDISSYVQLVEAKARVLGLLSRDSQG